MDSREENAKKEKYDAYVIKVLSCETDELEVSFPESTYYQDLKKRFNTIYLHPVIDCKNGSIICITIFVDNRNIVIKYPDDECLYEVCMFKKIFTLAKEEFVDKITKLGGVAEIINIKRTIRYKNIYEDFAEETPYSIPKLPNSLRLDRLWADIKINSLIMTHMISDCYKEYIDGFCVTHNIAMLEGVCYCCYIDNEAEDLNLKVDGLDTCSSTLCLKPAKPPNHFCSIECQSAKQQIDHYKLYKHSIKDKTLYSIIDYITKKFKEIGLFNLQLFDSELYNLISVFCKSRKFYLTIRISSETRKIMEEICGVGIGGATLDAVINISNKVKDELEELGQIIKKDIPDDEYDEI